METSTPVNKGKKRGRPKTSDISLTPISTDEDSSTPHRLSKRQRKPTKFPDFDLSDVESRISMPKTKNNSQATELTNDKNVEANNISCVDDSSNITNEDLSVSNDKLDYFNVDGAINSVDKGKTKSGKKRGRPKKNKTETANTETSIDADNKNSGRRKHSEDVGDLSEIKIEIPNDSDCPKSPERLLASPKSMKNMKDAVESLRKTKSLKKNVKGRGRTKKEPNIIGDVDNGTKNGEEISKSDNEVENLDYTKNDDSRVFNSEISGSKDVVSKKNVRLNIDDDIDDKNADLVEDLAKEHHGSHSSARVDISVSKDNVNDSVTHDISETPTMKVKKRGRPKNYNENVVDEMEEEHNGGIDNCVAKDSVNDSVTSNISDTPVVKVRKRGRPKKDDKKRDRVEDLREEHNGSHSNDGIDNSVAIDNDNDSVSTDISKTPLTKVRKRGRPKNYNENDDFVDELEEEHNDSHSNDRIDDSVANDNDNKNVTSDISKTPVTKGKKRGRPKKASDTTGNETNNSINCSSIVFHADSDITPRRGPGRPKKSEAEISEEVEEEEVKPKKRGRKKKTDILDESMDDDASFMENSSGKIKCVHCEFECKTVIQIRRHSANIHQIWWEPKCPQGLTNYAALVKVIGIRKFLNCPKCQKRLNFVQYFLKHMEWCGRESEMYQCEHCCKTLKAQWKDLHLRTCPGLVTYKEETEDKDKSPEEPDTTDGKSRKRKAAKKAMSIVHNLSKSADMVDDDDDNSRDPDAMVADDDDEDDDDDIDMDDDIVEEESDNGDVNDDDDIDDIVDEDGNVDYGTKNPSSKAFQSFACARVQPLQSYKHSKSFINENWESTVFEDWLPRKQDWKLLNSSESKPYQIETQSSVRFCFKKTDIPSSLKLYEGDIFRDTPMFYTGLCIWRACWCPVPFDCKDVQYIAVTGKLTQDQLFISDVRYTGPGLIQIWKTGITNNKVTSLDIPKLCYTIAHDYGLPTEMKWCPSGCYRTNVSKEDDSVYSRLGLLAVSFTDGTVRIFSVPDPADMDIESDVSPLIFKPQPVISLIPCINVDQQNITCTSIDWCLSKGHTKIIAGYSNGSVKVFLLTNESSLVKITTEKYGAALLPCQNLLPHGDVIRSIHWCSTSDHLFLTSSEKFETCFWDLNNMGIPIHCDEQCFMYLRTSSNIGLPGVFLTSEDSYTSQLNKSRYFEPGNMMFQNVIDSRRTDCQTFYTSAQAACIWDINCSNWSSFVVSCDNRGVILSAYVRDILKHVAEQKCYRFRMELFRTCIIKDKNSNNVDNTSHRTECKKCQKLQNSSVEVKNAKDKSNSLLVCTCDKNDQSRSLSQSSFDTSQNLTNENLETSNDLTDSTNQIGDNISMEISAENEDYTNKYKEVIMDRIKTRDKKMENCVLFFDENFKKPKACRFDSLQDSYNDQSLAPIKSMHLNPNNRQCCWLCFGGDTGLVRLANVKNLLPKHDLQDIMKHEQY